MGFFGNSAIGGFQRHIMPGALDRMQGAREVLAPGMIGQTFQGLQGIAAPTVNALLASEALGGQTAAQAAQAGLSRAGLGSTGVGASLGAGLRAGAAFRGNQLRARIFQDLMGEAIGLRSRESQLMGQFALGELGAGAQLAAADAMRPSPFQQLLQLGGTTAQAIASFKMPAPAGK